MIKSKTAGKPCKSKDDIPYYNNKGELKVISKKRKLTLVAEHGNRYVLKWGNRLFIVDKKDITIL